MSFKSKVVGVFGAAVMIFGMVAGASADTTSTADVNVQVNGTGQALSVAITTTQAFQAVNYSATTASSSTGKLQIVANDPRGTGQGWNVTIAASGDFTDTTDTTKTFPLLNNLTLKDGTIDAPSGGTISKNSVTVSTQPQTALSAAKKNGMGTVTEKDVTATVNIPAGTLAGSYKTTLTVQISSAP